MSVSMKLASSVCLGLCISTLYGQATSTASRRFDLQMGGQFAYVNSDYSPQAFRGFGGYASLDFTPHLGVEIDFRQANSTEDSVYERTYEIGGRYHRSYGRFSPYAKLLYGRGVFNFVNSGVVVANLAYNEFVIGGGVDFALLPRVNLRADYQYQTWLSFPSNRLTPQLVSIGAAYRFPGELEKGNRFR